MLETLIEQYGDGTVMFGAGGLVGVVFGLAAARSRFCLRAASAELAEGNAGAKLAIWLVAFFSALALVQITISAGKFDPTESRQLAATGSLSGAIIGGILFGSGMILARGCASRLLVLSASGNLRAIVTGLVLTLTAQASLRGILSPAREQLAGLWTVSGGADRHIGAILGLPQTVVTAISLLAFGLALIFAFRRKLEVVVIVTAAGVGFAVYLGWQLTYTIAQASFEIIAVQSVTFTGPSTDTLMALVNEPTHPPGFGMGLVPGVFIGAFLAHLAMGEARIQRFGPDTPMERYLIGGVLMGFGSMLAGGCAVGAGMSGGSILAVTAWVAVFAMWVGAMVTHLAMTRLGPVQTPAE